MLTIAGLVVMAGGSVRRLGRQVLWGQMAPGQAVVTGLFFMSAWSSA
jgi:hypothetical protein